MFIPLAVLLCFAFCCQESEDVAEEPGVKVLSAEDVAAIKAMGPALDAAALGGDWNALVALFTEDAVLMNPNVPSYHGRSSLMEMIENLGLTIAEHKIEFVVVDGYGDIAYARGTYAETFSVEGVDEQIKDEGKILTILRKQSDGSWLFAIWMSNSDLPLPE
jgi:uncharacterized protein (TIGR02246 family)